MYDDEDNMTNLGLRDPRLFFTFKICTNYLCWYIETYFLVFKIVATDNTTVRSIWTTLKKKTTDSAIDKSKLFDWINSWLYKLMFIMISYLKWKADKWGREYA